MKKNNFKFPASLHEKMIGLTGGMGSGKSSVAVLLRDLSQAEYIDSDQVCRNLLEPHAEGWYAVREAFGEKFFNSDETLNRPLLRDALFQKKNVRDQINQILHPLVRDKIAQMVQGVCRSVDEPLKFIVEVPLLFEAHWEDDFSKIVVVYADQSQCLERLMKRDCITIQEAEMAMGTQWPLADKVKLADHVVDNSGDWSETCLQVQHLSKILW